jgi:nucleotide-binding universal stress UspA family protein
MVIKTILVPVRGDGRGEGVLDHALTLARRFGAHIDVVHSRPRAKDLLPFGVLISESMKETILQSAEINAAGEEERVRTLFEVYCRKNTLSVVDGPGEGSEGVTISWRERTGTQAAVVAVHGRLADVVVVAQPDSGGLGLNTLESALLETGKLVLMAPPEPIETLGGNIALAWNGGAEAAGAVTAAMDLLAAADTVTILSAPSSVRDELTGEDLVRHLKWYGVAADLRILDVRSHEVGNALLEAAKETGADLLLMGGYGHDHRRKLVMGGVTRHIIGAAHLPVMMLH